MTKEKINKELDPELQELIKIANNNEYVSIGIFEDPINNFKQNLEMEIFLDDHIEAGYKIYRFDNDKKTKKDRVIMIRKPENN